MPKTPTKHDLLINKKWKVISLSGIINGVFYPDQYSSLPDWAKDDYFYFYDNLTYEINAGAVKEAGATSQITDSGSWQLTSSDQFITLTTVELGHRNGLLKILELTDTKLTVEENDAATGNVIDHSYGAIP
jgi:hypothetical protein